MSEGHTRIEHYPGPTHQPIQKDAGSALHAGEVHAEPAHHPRLQHHFDTMEQQAEASTLGMWTFLVTEILFFGGLFMAYLVYRSQSPSAFQEASHHLDVTLGTLNTAVLIISSLTMALGVRSAQTSEPPRRQVMWILLTMMLGAVFPSSRRSSMPRSSATTSSPARTSGGKVCIRRARRCSTRCISA